MYHYKIMTELELQKRLADNIKRFRKAQNLSQFELAEKIDINENSLVSIENCRLWPSEKTLTKLSAGLGIDPFQLFLPTKDALKNPEAFPELKESAKQIVSDLLNLTLETL